MAWNSLGARTRTYRGWTKNPKYGYRGNRDGNSAPTNEEFESKKDVEAMQRHAEFMAERNAKIERTLERITRVVEHGDSGVVVKVVDEYVLAPDVRHPSNAPGCLMFTRNSPQESKYFNPNWASPGTLLPGAVGIYLGIEKISAKMYIAKRVRETTIVAHKFVFGSDVVYFLQEALGYLEVVE